MIGGKYCCENIPKEMILSDGTELTPGNIEFLWKIFVQIGHCWKNVKYESSNLKSSWLEFVQAKTTVAPSYTGEYLNAIKCVLELINIYDETHAFYNLFLANGIGREDPKATQLTRLAHAKKFVINEFIRMQVMASGFKHFGGENYAGYVKGSRYSLNPEVREFVELEQNTYNQK
jgi:hypothetical protein